MFVFFLFQNPKHCLNSSKFPATGQTHRRSGSHQQPVQYFRWQNSTDDFWSLGAKVMVYFLGDWGMGDSECATCQHVPNHLQSHLQSSQHQTLSISRASELIRQRTASITQDEQENDDEVALHPLSNQVNTKKKKKLYKFNVFRLLRNVEPNVLYAERRYYQLRRTDHIFLNS